jgi:thymidine phosphorylase
MEVPAPVEGVITRIDTRAVGEIVVALGGGRRRETDRVNPSVGLSEIAAVGEEVSPELPVARIHAASQSDAEAAARALLAAIEIGSAAPERPLIHRRIG